MAVLKENHRFKEIGGTGFMHKKENHI